MKKREARIIVRCIYRHNPSIIRVIYRVRRDTQNQRIDIGEVQFNMFDQRQWCSTRLAIGYQGADTRPLPLLLIISSLYSIHRGCDVRFELRVEKSWEIAEAIMMPSEL
jgi:hypothetical protein